MQERQASWWLESSMGSGPFHRRCLAGSPVSKPSKKAPPFRAKTLEDAEQEVLKSRQKLEDAKEPAKTRRC